MPGKATLATVAAVLACGVIGVLIGTYVHEVHGPRASQPASYREGAAAPTTSRSTGVTTLVVPVPPNHPSTSPAHPTPPASTSTRTVTPTPSSPPPSAPSSSSAPSSAPSSSSQAPSGEESCGGLLGCLFHSGR